MTREEMKFKLETVLSPKRFIHSLNVMNTAMDLAQRHGVDREKAGIAGLLHDCAREIRGEEAFSLCEKYGIVLDYVTRAQPELLHGPLGYYLAEEEYGVTQQDILDAIYYHTTGGENMDLLGKIVFMADYIEPNRSFPGVDEVRREARLNIDKALILALDRTIKYVMMRGAYIHPDTIKARNAVLRSMGGVAGRNVNNREGFKRR